MSKSTTKYVVPLSLLSGIAHGITIIATSWWLKSVNASYTQIGLFTLANFAHGLTFLWIPFLDKIDLRYYLAKIGIKFNQPIQRKGFIFLFVSLMSIAIFIASFANPRQSILSLAIPIAFAGIFLATADSVMLAYMYETLQPKDMGANTAGYRLGNFVGSICLMFLHDALKIDWSIIFRISPFALLLLVSILFISPKEKEHKPKSWEESFVKPYQNFFQTYKASFIIIILFIVIYKMHDRFIQPMEQFFLRDMLGATGFYIIKIISTFALSFSAMKSGPLLTRFGYKGTLSISIIAGIFTIACYYLCSTKVFEMQLLCTVIAFALLGIFYYLIKNKRRYILISIAAAGVFTLLLGSGVIGGAQMIAVFATVIIAKMTAGIRNSSLFSYQTALCSKEYALTQVSVFTGLEKLSALALQSSSGYSLSKFGWAKFYFIALIMSVLPLCLISITRYPAKISPKKPKDEEVIEE